MRGIYCVASWKVYVRVHFSWRISAKPKYRFCLNQRHPCRYWKCSTYKKYACALFLFAPCICTVYFKRLTEGLYTRMPLLKTILDVSERTRMSVDWAVASFSREKLVVDQCTRRYTGQQAICKSIGKAQLLRAAHKLILNVAERTGMSVVISSSDAFAQQKLAFKNWQGGQFLNLARMPLVPRSNKFARQTCSPKYTRMYILDEDGGGDKQQRCFCTVKTRSQQMYTDVHFWTMASVSTFKRHCRLNLQVLPRAKRCYWKSSTYQNASLVCGDIKENN